MLTALALLSTIWCGEAGSFPPERVTLVVLNRLSLEDLLDNPNASFSRLAGMGGVGLMNTRTGGGLTPDNAYTSLGGGFRLVGAAGAKVALPAQDEYHGEKAGDVYRRRTGKEVPSGSIVVLDIESIKANNLASIGIDRVGVIGGALREAGKKTALIGNADGDECQRWAALIAMDGTGQVTSGSIGMEMNRVDPEFPTGRRTDLDALWSAYLSVRPTAQFIVIDLGDMDRVETEKKQLSTSQYHTYRQAALQTAHLFLDALLAEVDLEREWVLVVSPMPTGAEMQAGGLLTPLIVAGPGVVPGLLISHTTRRPGVITNYDIAPSVLSWLDLPRPKGLPGAVLTGTDKAPGIRRWSVEGDSGGRDAALLDGKELLRSRLVYLQDVLTRSAATYRQRPSVLRAFVTMEIVIYLTVFGLLAVFPGLAGEWTGVLSFLMLLVAAMPLALLILPMLRPATVAAAFVCTLVAGMSFSGLAWRLTHGTVKRYGIICGLTAAALVTDAFLGGPLVKFSPLGYDVMLGARFYGIGNEYMGILVGSSLLAALVARERWPKMATATLMWFFVVVFVLASPELGANAGGTITALIAFPLAYGLEERGGRRATAMAVLAVLGIALLLNLFPSGGLGSHVTRILKVAAQGEWAEIVEIFQRKLAMNWKLMRYSIWSKGLLVALGVMGVLVYRPTPVVKAALIEYPSVRGIVFSTIIASLAALVLNDSGVVAGGTTSVYAAGLVLSMVIEQRGKTPVDT